MRRDLRMLIAAAVARRSLEESFPARLLPLIKTSEKINNNHLSEIKALRGTAKCQEIVSDEMRNR
jgi:hypothetical protein